MAVELELHQLTLRYERLRKCAQVRERALLSSLSEIGQQLPLVVISENTQFVLIDGYKRVRALKRLSRDTARGVCWELAEIDALLLERSLRQGSEDMFDQAWLLAELRERFGLSLGELAQRFERSKSWICRRLSLIELLPVAIQEQVRAGTLSGHAAMKYLVPLARANLNAAVQLAASLQAINPTVREVGTLYAGWQSGTERTRQLIQSSPQIYLKAHSAQVPTPPSATWRLVNDLGALGGIARRARGFLQGGVLRELLDEERGEVDQAFARAKSDALKFFARFELEAGHAG